MSNYRKGQRVVDSGLSVDMDCDTFPASMFYHALIQRNVYAWAWIQQSYREMVLEWLHSHPQAEAACRINSEDVYVAQAFERLWQATREAQRFEWNTLSTAMQYLQASLNSVLLEAVRAANTPEAKGGDEKAGKLWETLLKLVPDVREQRLAYLLYHCALRPKEIVQRCPLEFNDLQEITRLRLNILKRLLHNPGTLRQWLASGQL